MCDRVLMSAGEERQGIVVAKSIPLSHQVQDSHEILSQIELLAHRSESYERKRRERASPT